MRRKILVVRPDRLGDVILSTPVFEAVRKSDPQAEISVLVRKPVVSILNGLPTIDRILVFDPEGRHAGVSGFFRLAEEIRERNFDVALVLQSHSKIAAALFWAGVKIRIGPRSKIHSYLFYNRGKRQSRSLVEKHEADYNLELLECMGVVPPQGNSTQVSISREVRDAAQKWLLEYGWQTDKPLVLVHPGMGGSALNWPEEHYIELIHQLLQEGLQVLVTGGETEYDLLRRLQAQLGKAMFYFSPPGQTVDFLGGLCALASAVVAPSTGPLHLAVALGRPVLSFYPPIRVQSPKRWGPYVAQKTSHVMMPEVNCGQEFKCLGDKCPHYYCMGQLSVKTALEKIHQMIQK